MKPCVRLWGILGLWALMINSGCGRAANLADTPRQPGQTPEAKSPIAIDANFPGGNIILERIEGDTVYLRQDLRDTQGWWFYWSFRVTNAAGRKLTFNFTHGNPIGVLGPAVSTDGGRQWAWLGAAAATDQSFTYAFDRDSGEVRFCFAIPYQQADLKNFLARHADNPSLKSGQLCKSRKGRPVELLRAGRLDGDPPYRVLLTARHHACESMADYALEGILHAALADDEGGRWFRRNVELMAVPFMDKDGVEDGDQGKNRRPHDHNRDYLGKSIYPSVAALRELVPNWADGRLKIALDLHCPYIRGSYNEVIYIVGSENERIWREQLEFGRILEDIQTGPLTYKNDDILPFGKGWNTGAAYGARKSCSRWAGELDGIWLSAGLEIPYANAGGQPVTAESARSFGRDLAYAIRRYIEQTDRRHDANRAAEPRPLAVNSVFPQLTVMAKGTGSDSEAGIGALIPWAEKLWAIGYVAHIRGRGLGLYEISDDMTMRRHPASVHGTFANRFPHWPSGQAFIGPHAIDADGSVRTIDALKGYRLTATMSHLTDPKNKVYFLGMEGRFWEVDVHNLQATQLFNLVKELNIKNAKEHFKGATCAAGRVVVANNTYDEAEHLGTRSAGRLAEWDGKTWKIIEQNPFVGVGRTGSAGYGGPTIFATGWNRSSVILRVYNRGSWSRYLLPKGSHSFDHAWNTEWLRIRHAVTERLLMDAHGLFYELPPFAYEGKIWGIKPICSHLRVVPDFCHWRGLFVMASDQIDHDEGQPQSGLWFGNIDDLWRLGKPTGWGGPWWETPVKAGRPSDPFLMTGFDKKVLHLAHDSNKSIKFNLEVDFLGNGSWKPYETFEVGPRGYAHHEFPQGFSAHWVRLRAEKDCKATAYFMYN
ncbi:MAG: hypothetical protein JSU94_12185 [Phycisphaerales bacterium]|nr:MAG: hypothetical protein JSU94_12185 [Phycisphaerales bacterium]